MKTCNKCELEKGDECFGVDRRNTDGLSYTCKACVTERRHKDKERFKKNRRRTYLNNKQIVSERQKKFRLEHPDLVSDWAKKSYMKNREKRLARQKKYASLNRNRINKNCNRRRTENREEYLRRIRENCSGGKPAHLRSILRSRFYRAVRRGFKRGSAVRDLGCTIPEFKAYIEKQFKDGMSWDNYGKEGWHLDHIRPLASFDLTNREDVVQALHYTNYQPLSASDNLKKNSRWNGVLVRNNATALALSA